MVINYRKFHWTKLFLLLAVMFLVQTVNVMAIDVPDGDFETPLLADNGWAYVADIDSAWKVTVVGGGPWMGNNYSYGGLYPGIGHTGDQWVDMNGSRLHQELAETYTEGITYVLSAWVTTPDPGQELSGYFTVGGTNGWTGSQVLDEETQAVPVSDDHTWNELIFAYTATALDDGKPIGLCLLGDYVTYLDDVTLGFATYAVAKNPANGAPLASTTTSFDWYPPSAYTATGYDLEYRSDPNFASGGSEIVTGLTEPTYTPPTALEFETSYYWRVKSYGDTTPVDSPVFSFTTAPQTPAIVKDPEYVTVAAGDSATFTVVEVNGTSYQWYKAGVEIDGAESDSLTIDSVELSDEGYYHCVVTNSSGTAESAPARLLTERLIGHWPLDGNADDVVGSADGIVHGNPVWTTGVVGSGSIALEAGTSGDPNDNDYVVLGTPDDLVYNATDFTVALWYKTTPDNSDAGIISNKDWNSGANIGWVIATSPATDTFQWNFAGDIGGRSDYDPTEPVTDDGEWHYICITHDRDGFASMYVDGIMQGQVDITGSAGSVDSGYPTVIGTDGAEGATWAEWFTGSIDDVRIWSYVINPYGVAKLYTDVMTEEQLCVMPPPYDFNGDCKVDLTDMTIFAAKWLECNWAPDCLDQHDINLD